MDVVQLTREADMFDAWADEEKLLGHARVAAWEAWKERAQICYDGGKGKGGPDVGGTGN